MKVIETIAKFEDAADRHTDGIDDKGLMFFLSRVNTDNGFSVYKMPFCFEGFWVSIPLGRVHNNNPKYFWFG